MKYNYTKEEYLEIVKTHYKHSHPCSNCFLCKIRKKMESQGEIKPYFD